MPDNPTPHPAPPLDRAALRRLCEAATPGPWTLNDRHGAGRVESEHDHGVVNDGWILAELAGPDGKRNGKFIGAARTALPALLDALDAAEADVATLERYRDRLEDLLSDIVGEMGGSLPAPIPPEYVREVAYDAIHKIEDERDALRAEVERLRPVVAALLADIDGGWEGPSADLLERVAEYRASAERSGEGGR